VQAYQPRAPQTVEALLEIAGGRRKRGGMAIAVRLVKGAYWDAEVKRAQELGLARYPVFTDKRLTDLSYLALRPAALGRTGQRLPAVRHAQPGDARVRARAFPIGSTGPALRPRGSSASACTEWAERCTAHSQLRIRICRCARMHPSAERRELFAYLVRRLLENSASTSYVRQAARGNDPTICCAPVSNF